jgi:DNA-directed RNA polymerase specialized sigma24 family protein
MSMNTQILEIAELINLTPTSVRVRRSTGISKLKRKLERLNN